jgi:hypothetical protein
MSRTPSNRQTENQNIRKKERKEGRKRRQMRVQPEAAREKHASSKANGKKWQSEPKSSTGAHATAR